MPVQQCFISDSCDPFTNLSLEEYFLKTSEDDFFILYINEPTVVVGKHQNLLKEINAIWVFEHNIKVSRRLSGGGTVYQDFGNLNFSFIQNCDNLEKVNYKRFTSPILLALKTLNIEAGNSDRNDLLLNGMKISGNAMHIYKNRVLCHGTLLYNSNLQDLSLALRNNPERYLDKSIQSVRSKVTNVAPYLASLFTMEEFTNRIFQRTCDHLSDPRLYSPSSEEVKEFKNLAITKFSTWDWIYGYSPKYTFKNEIPSNGKLINFEFMVEKGIISDIAFPEDSAEESLFRIFINTPHDYPSILKLIEQHHLQDFIPQCTPGEFCRYFF